MDIRAITLDLDDTLWPIAPVMLRAEQRLHDWLETHCPEVAAAFPVPVMRAMRERMWAENPELAHDFTALRRLSLQQAFAPFGHDQDWVDRAFAEFYAARNDVELYPDALPALTRMAARWPLASISNGNADLGKIGLTHFFRFSISAREQGVGKPHPEIFAAACARLGLAPRQVLHVGDDPELDVAGARAAGLRSVWLNRNGEPWPQSLAADLEVRDLGELVAWLEALPVGANAPFGQNALPVAAAGRAG